LGLKPGSGENPRVGSWIRNRSGRLPKKNQVDADDPKEVQKKLLRE